MNLLKKAQSMPETYTPMQSEDADNLIQDVLKHVISASHSRSENDIVAKALLFFLVRAANSWRSIRTLRKNTADEEGFMIDAGTLLRAMYDACFQAEYVICEPDKSVLRATDYLEFEHVERYKFIERMLAHSNWIAERLKASPKREIGEVENQRQFDRVKARFGKGNKQSDSTRNHWYPGSLPQIAAALGKADEYDSFLAVFNGCVHSSAFALQFGPPVSAAYVLDMASTIAAKVARFSVAHNRIELSTTHKKVLDVLCSPQGDRYS
jgi:hypothetical protein